MAYTAEDVHLCADMYTHLLTHVTNPTTTELLMLNDSYQMMLDAHEPQRRASGEPYAIHPLTVATTVAELGMDADSVAAALLHDTVEDTPVTVEDISDRINPAVAAIVDGVTKLDRVAHHTRGANGTSTLTKEEQTARSLQKMMVAATSDVRVLVVKLADRLHNVSTLQWLPPAKQHRVAEETLQVYAPLAHRLGMDRVRAELEDRAFAALHPELYNAISVHIHQKNPQRDQLLADAMTRLRAALAEAGIPADVSGRNKTVYSVYRKMVARQVPIERVDDLVGVRIITDTTTDVYRALGIVHQVVTPLPGRIRDYIASPKFNMYQSLHTTALLGTMMLEVQIRTWEQHTAAELGVAAHWRYRYSEESATETSPLIPVSSELPWLERLSTRGYAVADPDEYLKELRADLSAGEIVVFTRSGDPLRVPDGTTVGTLHHYLPGVDTPVGARVNADLVSARHVLRPGDMVDVFDRPASNGVDPVDEPDVRTVTQEVTALLNEFAPPGWDKLVDVTTVADIVGIAVEQLPGAIGDGSVPQDWIETAISRLCDPALSAAADVDMLGSLPLVPAPCCNPAPGDLIVASLSHDVVVIHRQGCVRVRHDNLVDVDWTPVAPVSATVIVTGVDRPGFLSEIAQAVSNAGLNVHEHSGRTGRDRIAHLTLSMDLAGHTQLGHVAALLLRVPGVFAVDTSDTSESCTAVPEV